MRTGEVRAGAAADSPDILEFRLVALVVSLILLTVLLFSAAGVYSLMSFTVAHRRREIGIRTALGASRLHVLRGIFSRVALQVAAGVTVGAVVATAIVLIMMMVGLAAAYGPARRSLRIQPTEALRAE